MIVWIQGFSADTVWCINEIIGDIHLICQWITWCGWLVCFVFFPVFFFTFQIISKMDYDVTDINGWSWSVKSFYSEKPELLVKGGWGSDPGSPNSLKGQFQNSKDQKRSRNRHEMEAQQTGPVGGAHMDWYAPKSLTYSWDSSGRGQIILVEVNKIKTEDVTWYVSQRHH